MNFMPAKRDGRDMLLGVRPEHLVPCAPSEAELTADVDLVEPLGADTLVHGTVEGTRIIARLHAAFDAVEGKLPLRFDPANRHYFDAKSGRARRAPSGRSLRLSTPTRRSQSAAPGCGSGTAAPRAFAGRSARRPASSV